MNLKKKVFISNIKDVNEKDMTLTASISTNTVDRMGEVLDPCGVDLSNYRKNPVVLWAHDYSTPPIGKALWVKRSGNDAVVSKVQFADTVMGREIFGLYKDGFMNAFSVGFIPKDYVQGDGKKEPALTYTQWEMLEYSAVPVPANPDALALAVSKGLKLSVETLKALATPIEEEDENWGGQLKEEDVPTKIEKKIEIEKKDGLEELRAENILLKEQIISKDAETIKNNDEISDLKYKLYVLTQPKTSEIADGSVFDKINDAIVGAIRKAQGKV